MPRLTDIPFEDRSEDAMFSFAFTCPLCKRAFISQPVMSDWYKDYAPTNRLLKKTAALGDLLATQKAGAKKSSATLSPIWRRERMAAFLRAEKEMAKTHFAKCPQNGRYVCKQCLQSGRC